MNTRLQDFNYEFSAHVGAYKGHIVSETEHNQGRNSQRQNNYEQKGEAMYAFDVQMIIQLFTILAPFVGSKGMAII